MTKVMPSDISAKDRTKYQDEFGVCWNTSDDFDEDNSAYKPIMDYHRGLGTPHWYLPDHPELRRLPFNTELEAYEAAAKLPYRDYHPG